MGNNGKYNERERERKRGEGKEILITSVGFQIKRKEVEDG